MRAVAPRTTRTRLFGTPSASATSLHTAAFALPPSAGAATSALSSPVGVRSNPSRPARGVTLTVTRAATGPASVAFPAPR